MSSGEVLSRDELLSGRLQRGGRAARLLTAIESRTAHMSEETRRAIAAYFLSDEKDFTRRFHLDYLQGIKLVAQSPSHLTVEDLERYAPHWRALVPGDSELRMALLRLLAQRYPRTDPDLPGIGSALGVDAQTVREAYRGSHAPSIDGAPAEPPSSSSVRSQVLPQVSADERMLQEAAADVEWLQVPAGTVLCREGEPGDSLYVVISGRLSAVIAGENGDQQVVGEMSRGEIVGEIGVLTGENRTTTVSTLRDSELLKISQSSVISLAQRHPQIMMRLNRVLASRVRANLSPTRRATTTMITLAIIPTGPGVPLAEFTRGLVDTLAPYGSVLHLNSAQMEGRVGSDLAQIPQGHPEDARLMAWLSEQEHRHRYVVYEADATPSEWTSRCLRQADRVLIVADAGLDPAPGEIEAQLRRMKAPIRTELVLLHPAGTIQPRGTRRWLTPRQIQPYHHVRRGNEHDVQRLVRRLIGKAIGLVLSGGGARGFAHVGAIQAIEEAGIPIDMIGGTSTGALVGAGFALGGSAYTVSAVTIFGSRRKMLDATLPLTSVFATRKVTNLLHSVFEDIQIEDLWRPFFCIASNLTRAEPVVLQDGPVWECVRSSLAIPVVFSPVLRGDDILIDGGVLNNFPLDVMRGLCGSGTVIGVNTSPRRERVDDYHFGPSLSGWALLLSKLHLAAEPVRAPSLFSTLMRMIELNSAYRMKSDSFLSLADVLIEPPVEQFKILDLSSYAEIQEVGYRAAQQEIELWQHRESEHQAHAAS